MTERLVLAGLDRNLHAIDSQINHCHVALSLLPALSGTGNRAELTLLHTGAALEALGRSDVVGLADVP